MPVVFIHVDIEFLSGGLDPFPCLVAFGVGDAFYLVEPGDRVADVGGVVDRFLALLRERELRRRDSVFLRGTEPIGLTWNVLAVRSCALNRARRLQVLSPAAFCFAVAIPTDLPARPSDEPRPWCVAAKPNRRGLA
jgi:hypothetical protein